MPKSGTALITGANRGIGFEVSSKLGKLGFQVFLTARNPEKGMQAVARLQKEGAKACFVQLDLASTESITRAAGEVAAKTAHLDVLVNNAGILEDGCVSVLNISPEIVTRTFRTNTLGPLLVTQAFWPLLKTSGKGRVINLSSGAGQLYDMDDWAPAYSISKAALNAVTRQFAAAGRLVRIAVNSVCPGWVRTDMGTVNAPRSVEEGAATIVWLATEAPHDLTGQILRDQKPIPW